MTIATKDASDQLARVLDKIQVRPPYLAFGELNHLGGGFVSAPLPASSAVGNELGPWSASQVARHLAILGSCGAALDRDDDRSHHYLATSAHFARMAGCPTKAVVGQLEATAAASWIDRRTARAFVRLLGPAGEGLYNLDTTYAVMAPKMFDRFHERNTDLSGASGDELVVQDATYHELGVHADCGLIPEAVCRGHFPSYPAAPVAVVMGALGEASGLALNHRLGRRVKYRVEEARVTATALGQAGQRLRLNVDYESESERGHALHGVALANDTVIGELSVIMTAHGSQ